MKLTIEHNGTSYHNKMADEMRNHLTALNFDMDEMIDPEETGVSLWSDRVRIGTWHRIPHREELELRTMMFVDE